MFIVGTRMESDHNIKASQITTVSAEAGSVLLISNSACAVWNDTFVRHVYLSLCICIRILISKMHTKNFF